MLPSTSEPPDLSRAQPDVGAARPIAAEDLAQALASAERAFASLRGARILVTGGTGFFGAWLVESLAFARDALALDVELDLLTRDPRAWAARMPHLAALGWLRPIEGDVRSFTPGRARYTHVVHGATASSTPPGAVDDPGEFASVIVDGARRVAAVARACGAERLLFTSSGAVYGAAPAPMREDASWAADPLDPAQTYGNAKRLAECLLAGAGGHGGPAVVVARCFAFVGAHLPLDRHFAIGNFIADGLAGRVVRVRGDGAARRSYLYGSDLAAWLWTILAEGRGGRAYNVGSDEAVSVGELAARVGALFGVGHVIEGAPSPGALRREYAPDVTRAREELGLAVRVGLDDAVARTARWHRSR